MLLSAEHISKNFGMKQLLDNVSLYLNERDRIGIVGMNGTGKSTLLKILAGIEPTDEGAILYSSNLKVTYLPQNPSLNDEISVLEQVLEAVSPQLRVSSEYQAKAMINRLGVNFEAIIGTLSGGQRKRVALAMALINPSDILILDEPTNHLDCEMVCWLEQYLSRFTGGLIMVTHDRYFLERIVNHITELSHSKLYTYEANYSKYLELKAQRGEMDNSSERKRQSILRREYQWIMRGAKARSTKSRERIERYNELASREAPESDEKVQISTISSRLGNKIIELCNLTKAFDDRTIITDFSFMVSRDDRIGIVGKNGAGKSTLLNMIAGSILPDSGTVDVGATVKIGYFTQECCDMNFSMRVYDFICQVANEIKTNEGTFSASQMLERFLFTSDMQYTIIQRLSGGERRRLYLLSILMAMPNILLLDEPTNDLDIETLTILEDYLQSFPGAVIAVSHDRYFLDKIASSIFEVGENGDVNNYLGNYSDYSQKRTPTTVIIDKKPITKKNTILPKDNDSILPKKTKFSFGEQREFDSIDSDIAELEVKISECSQQIALCASDYVQLQSLMSQKELLIAALDTKTERWVYLNELFDKINNV